MPHTTPLCPVLTKGARRECAGWLTSTDPDPEGFHLGKIRSYFARAPANKCEALFWVRAKARGIQRRYH